MLHSEETLNLIDCFYWGHGASKSAPLFATGLGGLGLLSWRRKRQAQAVG